jgi:hypothetical protein
MRRAVRPALGKLANAATRAIAVRWGEAFPIYAVAEFPRSGGTWLGQMAADCLQLPFPQHPVLPVAMPAVIHNHWRYSPHLKRVFYMCRDGRDVMVSLYFHRMRRVAEQRNAADALARRRYERLFGPGYDAADVARWLPRFIEHDFTSRSRPPWSWSAHIADWYDPAARPHVAYIRYENLIRAPLETVRTAVEHVARRPVDPWRVEMAVEKYSMVRQTGRQPGHEDRRAFIRKGVVGDWRYHFTREAADVFCHFGGGALIQLGYERDGQWINSIS